MVSPGDGWRYLEVESRDFRLVKTLFDLLILTGCCDGLSQGGLSLVVEEEKLLVCPFINGVLKCELYSPTPG